MSKQDEVKKRIEYWERNRRKWYNFYFFMGIGINFLLYFTKPWGFDPSGSILWGSFYGIAIPLITMFLGAYIHEKILGL
ncbi:MAG: hypothetical protein B6I26_07880 [Desulfobacteraceae bacterium 4572_130]|nr:MAG: hypothetical protein B6I26_07880 [Desulfobacteraceae bacterium 4572_130]